MPCQQQNNPGMVERKLQLVSLGFCEWQSLFDTILDAVRAERMRLYKKCDTTTSHHKFDNAITKKLIMDNE